MIANFKKSCKEGPEYICSSCYRFRYRKSVFICNPLKYKDQIIAQLKEDSVQRELQWNKEK